MRSPLFAAVLAVGAVLAADRSASAQGYYPAYGYFNPYVSGYYTPHGRFVPGYGYPAANYGNQFPGVSSPNGMNTLKSNSYYMPQAGAPYAGQAYNTYYGYTRPGFRRY